MKRSVTAAMVVMLSMLYAVYCQAQILGTGQLGAARRGHTATLLQDGKILIVGGDNSNGLVGQAEIFDPMALTSSNTSSNPVSLRTDHTAALLADGRVLIIGGVDGNGLLGSTEFYNPYSVPAPSFSAGPVLMRARSGHTATVLADGKILIAGGEASGSAEIFDPATQTISLVNGSLNTPRQYHSAALLNSGKVLIAGGVVGTNTTLTSAEIYDPLTQTFTPASGAMQTPRGLALLRVLPDGKVQVIGGDGEFSMEMFDPATNSFIALAHIPPHEDYLDSIITSRTRSALITTIIQQNPVLQGQPELTPEFIALLNRLDHTVTEIPQSNRALIAGGVNDAGQILSSATVVSSSAAMITTDRFDYSPGEIVTITGQGWQPNETVWMLLHEEPETHTDVIISSVADSQGNFANTDFAPALNDLDRNFTLTAIGQVSGFTAQTAFKDASNLGKITTVGVQTPSPVPAGNSATYSVSVSFTGSGASCTTVLSTSALPAGVSASFASVPSGNPANTITGTGGSSVTTTLTISTTAGMTPVTTTFVITASGGTCGGSASTNPTGTGGNAVNPTLAVSKAVSTTTFGAAPTPSYLGGNFTVIASNNSGGAITYSRVSGPCALVSGATFSSSGAGSCVVQADSATTTNYLASSAQQPVTIAKANQAALTLNTTSPLIYNQSETLSVTGGSTGGTVTYNLGSGSCTIVGNQLTANSGTGSCTLTATMAGDSNYNDVTSTPANTVTLAKANQVLLTLTGVPGTAAYQSMFTVTPGGGSSSNPLVVSTTPASVCTNSGNVVTMQSGTGTCTVKVNRAGDSNYNDAIEVSASATATKINQALLTLNTTSPLIYNQSETLSVTGGSTGGTVTYNLGSGFCTIVGNQLTANSGTGSCTLTATMAGDSNYNDVTSTPANTVTLAKANQAALTLNTTSPLIYNQSETLSVTGGSTGGTVTYNLGSGFCTIVGNQLTANSGTGSCTLTATMAGDSNYNDVTSTPANTVTLAKANQAALTLNTTSPLIYNQSETLSVTGGSTGGTVTYNLGSGFCTIVGNQLTANSGTGSCTLTATMAGDSNYNDVTSTPANTVTLAKANQAALTLNTTSPLIYNQSETLSVTGGSTGGTVTYNLGSGFCTIVGNQLTANSGTGSCTLTATMAGDSNYNDVTSTPANTVTLAKANQAALTLNTTSPLIYNQSETLSVTGGSTGGTVTYNLGSGFCTIVGNQLTANSGTGSCTLTATMAGDSNYNDVTSTPANTVTLAKANQAALTLNTTSPLIYNQSETLSVTGGSTGGTVTYNLGSGFCTIVGNQLTANSGTGSCTLTATMAGDSNYNDVTSTPANTVTLAKANQAALTVTGPSSVTFGTTGTATATGGSGTGVLSFSASGSGCTVSGTDVSVTNASGTCSLTATKAGDNNYYAATSASFTVTLFKASAICTVTGFNGTHDGLAHGATGSCTGVGGPSDVLTGLSIAPTTYTNVPGGLVHWTFTNNNYVEQSGDATVTITTAFAYDGFYSPISGYGGSYGNTVKTFKLGSTIPVKFSATWLISGAPLITGSHTLQAIKYSNATDSDLPIDATPTDSATTGNQFRLTDTEWHFNLSTKGNGFSAGTWLLIATLQDGSKHSVWITLKK